MSANADSSNHGEDEMSDPVRCINVGGEYHSVEEEFGELLPKVGNLSEQCDNCGSSGEYVYSVQATKTGGVVTQNPGYSCVECGSWYEIVERVASRVVF